MFKVSHVNKLPFVKLGHTGTAVKRIAADLCNQYSNVTVGDVGGGTGKLRLALSSLPVSYTLIDAHPRCKGDYVVRADICKSPATGTYRLVVCRNVLEHVIDPSAACEFLRNSVCNDGTLFVIAPFSWRYHPCPADYWRFSHTILHQLLNYDDMFNEVLLAYDIGRRRTWQCPDGILEGRQDAPPVDAMGGWLETWSTVFIGKRR